MVLSWWLCCLLAGTSLPAQAPSGQLNLIVIGGEGVVSQTGARNNQVPGVRVEDASGKPVQGAAVVFSLPTEGTSGEFSDGSKTLVATTNSQGEAMATGLRANGIPGRLQIHVNASWRGMTARTNITQFVMSIPGKRSGSGKKAALILLAIGGAAAGGVLAATMGGKKSSPASGPGTVPPPVAIGITPGTGTVGPPR